MHLLDDMFTALGFITLLFIIACIVMLVRDGMVLTYNHFKKRRDKACGPLYGGRYNRDTTWGTLDGREIPIRCLDDTHLANIIAWVKDRPLNYRYELLAVLKKEAKIRKLSQEFLDGAPYPFRDIDGKWKKGVEIKNGTAQYRKIGR